MLGFGEKKMDLIDVAPVMAAVAVPDGVSGQTGVSGQGVSGQEFQDRSFRTDELTPIVSRSGSDGICVDKASPKSPRAPI